MENAMITMKNINKGYMLGEERLPILKDINFQVNKGEYVAILGPSGSGKTTLMNMIGCMDEEAEEKCKNTIKLLGLDHRIGHKPNELSGGQKQRVSIARALVGQPAILLADEPTGALDQTSGKEVLKLFRELNDMGNTIVMITHDLGVAQSAKRIVRIVDGQLQE